MDQSFVTMNHPNTQTQIAAKVASEEFLNIFNTIVNAGRIEFPVTTLLYLMATLQTLRETSTECHSRSQHKIRQPL